MFLQLSTAQNCELQRTDVSDSILSSNVPNFVKTVSLQTGMVWLYRFESSSQTVTCKTSCSIDRASLYNLVNETSLV